MLVDTDTLNIHRKRLFEKWHPSIPGPSLTASVPQGNSRYLRCAINNPFLSCLYSWNWNYAHNSVAIKLHLARLSLLEGYTDDEVFSVVIKHDQLTLSEFKHEFQKITRLISIRAKYLKFWKIWRHSKNYVTCPSLKPKKHGSEIRILRNRLRTEKKLNGKLLCKWCSEHLIMIVVIK